jgi:C-terminal processing protease CtpA/Prc
MRCSSWLPAALILGLTGAHAEDLLLGKVAMRAHAIVYDLPGVPSGQVKLLAGMMKQRFSQAEVIDAASTDESALREKLRKSFLLIATLDGKSRLLPAAADLLPLRVEGGTARWNDFAGPAKDLRVDFVGRNPYGAGYAAVIAAGSIALLETSDDGDYSYAIRNSEGVLRRGTYDEEFTPTTRGRLSLADARGDVREFFATLERIHPDPFVRAPEPAYRRMKEQTFTDLDTRALKDGRVTTEDLAYLLRYAAAFIRDGHTEMGWGVRSVYQEPMDGRRFPPFRFEFESGRFYITGANEASLVGQELVAVNGLPTTEFLRPALDRIAGETLAWQATRLADNQDFFLWFTNLVGKAGSCCRLTLRDGNGAESERTVEPVGIAQYGKIRATSQRKRPRHGDTEVKFFDSGKVAQFIYPAFRYTDEERKKIGEIFRQIRQAKSKDVIVDMRGNVGGEPMMGSLIFSYLTPKAVPQFQGGRIRISPEAMQNLVNGVNGLPLAHEGQLLELSDPEAFGRELVSSVAAAKELPKQEPFTGRLWLLVDHRTFSAANIFSMAFREYGLGRILGYETGEPEKIGGGIVLDFRLRNSGIPYRVSATQNFTGKFVAGGEEHGVLPDVPFDRKMLAPFHAEADPELAYTLDYIRKHL